MEEINLFLDPLLIAPYRLFGHTIWAWWLGTLCVAGLCVLLGELTIALGKRLNRATLEKSAGEARKMEKGSMSALRSGDKTAYKAMNKLANEAFGHAFFQRAALGAASLWPPFIAAGWMQRRFEGLDIPLLGDEITVTWLQGFLLCYLGLRIGLALTRWRIKRRRAATPPTAPPAAPGRPQ